MHDDISRGLFLNRKDLHKDLKEELVQAYLRGLRGSNFLSRTYVAVNRYVDAFQFHLNHELTHSGQ